jgi:hypothetical protein
VDTLRISFQERIRDLTRDFFGREWLLDKVNEFIQQGRDQYLLISGEAGIGKSAFAAHLVQRGVVQGYHFCQAREASTLDPMDFVRSITHQLAQHLPDFGRHIAEQEPVRINVTIDVGQVQDGSVYDLIPSTGSKA